MREIRLNDKEYLLLDIPDNVYDFCLHTIFISANQGSEYELPVDWFSDNFVNHNFERDYAVRGKIADILKDECICEGLVEKDDMGNDCSGYVKYTTGKNNLTWSMYKNATDSFYSWLKSINLDMTKEYVLIQKLQTNES